jgi:mRNA-degrading endonuclease RelE of RelBE toxin-antitoxin system
VTYAVLLHPKALRELEEIDEPARSRVKGHWRELGVDPTAQGKQLKHSDYWSLRVGDYRAVYEIWVERRQVVVLFIGHRKNVYDDFSRLF